MTAVSPYERNMTAIEREVQKRQRLARKSAYRYDWTRRRWDLVRLGDEMRMMLRGSAYI